METIIRTVQFNRYGAADVLHITDIRPPTPGANEVCIQVEAAGVNPKDCLVRKGKFRMVTGKKFPQTLGQDFSGRISAVGQSVNGFNSGDAVFGMVNRWAGGAYAEALVAPVSELAPRPYNLSAAQAAAVPLAAQTALQALRDLANVKRGQTVLINGASGGVGCFAIQIAKILGAEVTAVCSAANAELVSTLGADHVVDYRQQDPVQLPSQYDVFFDVFGNKNFTAAKPRLTRRGCYINTIPNPKTVAWHLATRWLLGKRGLLVVVRSRAQDLALLGQWIESGRLQPVVDRSYPLEEVAQAHRYIETKRARGKVVLVV